MLLVEHSFVTGEKALQCDMGVAESFYSQNFDFANHHRGTKHVLVCMVNHHRSPDELFLK